jgi:hypothetical protein
LLVRLFWEPPHRKNTEIRPTRLGFQIAFFLRLGERLRAQKNEFLEESLKQG